VHDGEGERDYVVESAPAADPRDRSGSGRHVGRRTKEVSWRGQTLRRPSRAEGEGVAQIGRRARALRR
jgi:hypothetical protein